MSNENVTMTLKFKNVIEKEKFKQKIIDAGISVKWNEGEQKERQLKTYIQTLKHKVTKLK